MRGVLPRMPTPGVPRIEPPRLETTVPVPGGGRGRRIGIAEYGDPDGPLVLWFHGTPGGRRQIPPAGRRAAADLGLRLVCVERPGVGGSTNHRYRCVADAAADAAAVADHLGHRRFAVAGLSGGGPYALACGALLADRVAAIGVLGGVCPVAGPDGDGNHGGLIALSARFQPLLQPLRNPLGLAVRGLIMATAPLAHVAYSQFAKVMPEGDRAVFADPGIEAMFIDDLTEANRRGFGALAHDIALFGADWGFRLADVAVPVRWWHGDADSLVSLADAQASCERLPDVELSVRPGESHLGGFAAADLVLETLAPFLAAAS